MEKDLYFDAQLKRLMLVTETTSLSGLARYLGVRQSAVSDARRRGAMPAEWFIGLMQIMNLNPEWILTGKGQPYLDAGTYEGDYSEWQLSEMREVLQKVPAKMLTDELQRRVLLAERQGREQLPETRENKDK